MLLSNPNPDAFALVTSKVDTADGKVTIFSPKADICGPNHYRDLMEYRLKDVIRPGDRVCEVGTACGLVPVMLKIWFADQIQYFGCEPVLLNYVATIATCLANGFLPDLAYCGLGDRNSEACFRLGPQNVGGANEGEPLEGHMYCRAPFLTPFEFLDKRVYDVLILDCEGAEHDIAHLLPKCRAIVGECHDFAHRRAIGQTYEKTLEVLKTKADFVQMPNLHVS